MLHPIIMAGGSGTRFWPRSRRSRPKQLIRIVGRGTMIQQTVSRIAGGLPAENILVVTNAEQIAEMRRQLPRLRPEQFVAEPCGRDTAACIGLAATLVLRKDPDAVMAVCSADHVISPAEEFVRCLKGAAEVAEASRALVTFGIRPTNPSTLYGYLRRGGEIASGARAGLRAYALREFREKPDQAAAEGFLQSGDYYWNSGNFVWRARDILDAIRRFIPDLYAGLERIAPAIGTKQEADVLASEYPRLPKTSIDYGVMEKAENAAVVEATFAWDDVGAWDAVVRHREPDAFGNTAIGTHVGMDTRNCVLAAEDGHLLATIGVENLIVVQTPDATLVCDHRRAADVKALVSLLQEKGLDAYL